MMIGTMSKMVLIPIAGYEVDFRIFLTATKKTEIRCCPAGDFRRKQSESFVSSSTRQSTNSNRYLPTSSLNLSSPDCPRPYMANVFRRLQQTHQWRERRTCMTTTLMVIPSKHRHR